MKFVQESKCSIYIRQLGLKVSTAFEIDNYFPFQQSNPLDASIKGDLMSFGCSPDKSDNLMSFDDPFPNAALDAKKVVNILDAEPDVAVSSSAELQILKDQLQDITNALEKNKHALEERENTLKKKDGEIVQVR